MRWIAAALALAVAAVFVPLPSSVRNESALGSLFLLENVQQRPSLFQRARAWMESLDAHGGSHRPDRKWRHLRLFARTSEDAPLRELDHGLRTHHLHPSPSREALAWTGWSLHVHHAPTGRTWTSQPGDQRDVHWVTDNLLLLSCWGVEAIHLETEHDVGFVAAPAVGLLDVATMSEIPYREELVEAWVLDNFQSDDAATLYRMARLAGELQLASAVPHLQAQLEENLDPYLFEPALDRIAQGDAVRRR